MPGLLDPFNVPKAALLRILGLALLACATIETLLTRRSRAPRSPAAPAPGVRWTRVLDLAVLAWCAVSLLSTLFGVSPRLSVLGELEQREGLLTTLALAGFFFGARRSHRSSEDGLRTLDTVLIAASASAAYALIQLAGLDPLSWANPMRYSGEGVSVLRPSGTLGNPILLGAVLAAALALVVERLARGTGDAAWLAPAAALLAVAAFATLSRGVWLASASAIAAGCALPLPAAPSGRARRLALALSSTLVPVALVALFALRAPFVARVSEGTTLASPSSAMRAELAKSALELGSSRPLFGSGPDTFGLEFPRVQTAAFWRDEWIGMPAHAHSVPLQILATLGVAGLVASLLWLLALARLAIATRSLAPEARGEHAGALAALLALGVAGSVNPVGLAGAALFAVLSASLASRLASDGQPHPASRTARVVAIGAAALVALAALLHAGREREALAEASRTRAVLEASVISDEPLSPGAIRAAAESASRAASRLPGEDGLRRLACDAWLAAARASLAAFDEASALGAVERARTEAEEALRLEPRRATNAERLATTLATRARLNAGSGADRYRDDRRSDSLFMAAIGRAPRDAFLRVEFARSQLARGEFRAAFANARAIVALYPGAASGHALTAAAWAGIGRRDSAAVALERAFRSRWEDPSSRERARAWAQLEGFPIPEDAARDAPAAVKGVARVALAGPAERGRPMVVSGRVVGASGSGLAGVSVNVYHADARGEYGHLSRMFRSGDGGEFEIRTIRPGSEHIHFVIAGEMFELHFGDSSPEQQRPELAPEPPSLVAGDSSLDAELRRLTRERPLGFAGGTVAGNLVRPVTTDSLGVQHVRVEVRIGSGWRAR